jgi:hypothetical protein
LPANHTASGTVRATPSQQLTFVTVDGAGHLSPMDFPEGLLYLFDQFIHNRTIA